MLFTNVFFTKFDYLMHFDFVLLCPTDNRMLRMGPNICKSFKVIDTMPIVT